MRSILLILLLLPFCSADLTTILAIRTCDVLKVRCDALPYRTVYLESFCHFVIDALADEAATTKQCSLAMRGAKLAPGAPDRVWSWLFADKKDYLLAGVASVNKTKAMCIYEHIGFFTGNAPPCTPDSSLSLVREGTCSAKTKEVEKFFARIAVYQAVFAPVIVDLPEKFEPGQEIIFKGAGRPAISNDPAGNDFIINFQSSAQNIQLQIWIVFSTKLVFLNSVLNGARGVAEQKSHTLLIGQPFEVLIRVREGHFKICIDGKDLADYKYRQPLASITQFEAINQFGYLTSYQLAKTSKSFPLVTGAQDGFPICNQTKRNECKSLVVSGTVKPGFFRSVINIYRKHGDMNMHVNFCYDRNNAYITIFSNGAFLHQINVYKPYPKPGEHMEVEFVNEEGGFQILVNGEDFYFYTHRIPSFDIAGVEISNLLEPVVTFRPAREQKIGARIALENDAPTCYTPIIVQLPQKIEPGHKMVFNAISTLSNEFTLNLQSVGAKSIQMQMKIYFQQKQIYLNSFFTHIAGTAEIKPHTLVVGKNFEIIIESKEDRFKISIDGKAFTEYKYRQPLAFIDNFEVKGSGFLNSYKLGEKATAYPSVTGEADSFPVCKNSSPKDKCKTLVVSGLLSSEWNRGLINLYRRNGDMPIHINFMYLTNSIYLDTATNGQWWAQRPWFYNIQFPQPGELMEIEIVNGETAFQVSMNGKQLFNFTHRMPSFDISMVDVSDFRDPVITFK